MNVELASPEHFIPVPMGWEERSPIIKQVGKVTYRHYDFVAQALSKIERGHGRDLDDVRQMVAHGLITGAQVREMFAGIEGDLYRYPAIDPPSFRRAVDAVFPPHDALATPATGKLLRADHRRGPGAHLAFGAFASGAASRPSP